MDILTLLSLERSSSVGKGRPISYYTPSAPTIMATLNHHEVGNEEEVVGGDDEVVDVDDLRQRGNHEFQQGNLSNAIAFYTSAIDHSKPPPTTTTRTATNSSSSSSYIVNLCNRSACHYQLEDYEQALDDAQMAWITSQQSNVKAAYRLTKTYLALQQSMTAIEVIKTALTVPDLSDMEITTLKDLLQQATNLQQQEQQQDPSSSSTTAVMELSIKNVTRPISIREFNKESSKKALGVGNFSEIIIVTHKITKETFALKILEKKQATDLAKRQHVSVSLSGF